MKDEDQVLIHDRLDAVDKGLDLALDITEALHVVECAGLGLRVALCSHRPILEIFDQRSGRVYYDGLCGFSLGRFQIGQHFLIVGRAQDGCVHPVKRIRSADAVFEVDQQRVRAIVAVAQSEGGLSDSGAAVKDHAERLF